MSEWAGPPPAMAIARNCTKELEPIHLGHVDVDDGPSGIQRQIGRSAACAGYAAAGARVQAASVP
jgi:hypothetical protein